MTMETVAFPPVDLRREIKPVDYNPLEVMIGTADVEEAGSFEGDIDLKKVQEVFAKSYPTVEAGAQVLEAYGIVEGSEQSALRAGLVRFLSDAKFDLSIHCTRVSLSARRRTEFGDATSIQPYSVEFGNPFPGPKRGDAHHSVELIYLFDTFHDVLVNADKGIFKPYVEFYAEPSAGQERDFIEQKTTAGLGTCAMSHLDLVHNLQDHWIRFIVGKLVWKVGEGEILVWAKDKSTRVEQLAKTPKWVERLDRLRLLEKDVPSIRKVLRGLY